MKEASIHSPIIEKIESVPTAPDRDFSVDRSGDAPLAETERQERLAALREWTRRYLEDRFPEYGPDTESDFIEYCRLYGFENSSQSDRSQDTSTETADGKADIGSAVTETFLHEIIGIMREHSDDPKETARFQESLSDHSRFDRWGFEELDDAAFVSVFTDYERGVKLPGSDTPFSLMRTYFAGRLASMNESDLWKLADTLSERPPGERMDIVRFLPIPMPLDEDDFEPPKDIREDYRRRFRFLLGRLADTDIAAIRFSALHRLANQEAYWNKCDKAGGEAFLEHEDASLEKPEAPLPLKGRIVTDKTLPYHYSAGRIATDAIAFFDGSGFPRYIARASSEQLDQLKETTPSTDWPVIADARRSIRENPLTSSEESYEAVKKIHEALFPEILPSDSASLARKYYEVSKTLDESDWKTLFELKETFDSLVNDDWEAREDRSELSEEAWIELDLLQTPDSGRFYEYLDLTCLTGSKHQERETEIRKRIDAILEKIAARGNTFRSETLATLSGKMEGAKKSGELIEAELISYDAFENNPDLNPFGNIDSESIRMIRNLHAPDAKDFLGMDYSKLPLRAQIYFLSFRGKERASDAERFRLALDRHKTVADDLAYSFLATAESPEYGETILSLAERLDTETLGPILRKYAEITKDADAVSEYIRESFPNLEPEGVERETLAISKNLLRRGRDILVEFSKQSDTDPETLLRKLDEARTDVILYKTAFRTLHESGSKEDLAEMMRSEIVSLQGTELSEDEQEDLLSIYGRNYPESEQYPAEFREKIFDGLRSALRNPDSRFYLLRREGKIIGFRRFDAKGETEGGKSRKYAGSFNVDSAYRDAKIGEVFYQVTLEREGADSVIEAYVDPEAPVSSFYVERYGYGIDGVTEISGKPFLQMRRDLEANEAFITRSSDFDELVPDITEHMEEINERLSSVSVHTVDRSELFDLVRAKTKEGWTLTRLPYGKGGRDGGKVVAVFENPSLRKRVANATVKETLSEAA
ncbi:MAG: hypothetical protein HGA38_03335 [Candidatus Moranbacteria bacterium]|nr:hypothetical protein [Candidatus Moranbacteria bacterium]